MKKNIFEISNPFDWSRAVPNSSEFAGRNDEIDIVDNIFKEVEVGKCINLAIIGERACGKTSLLNIIKQKANEKSALVVKIDLTETFVRKDLDLIVAIFDAIIENGVGRGLLGGESSCYYLSWRKNLDLHELNNELSENFLRIGTIFANAVEKKQEITLWPNWVRDDFQLILDDAIKNEMPFIVILIDEAQLLNLNRGFLQLIRNIIQDLPQLIFILAGTEGMFDLMDDVFSAMPRQFKKIHLKDFKDVVETVECVFKPLENMGIKRHDIRNFISFDTILQMHRRTNGNPYHVKLLAYFMFQEFQSNKKSDSELEINQHVLESVFENIQKDTTESSRTINSVLHQSSRDQLISLGYLTKFMGMNLYESALIENAYSKIDISTIKDYIANILRTYKKISSLNLIQLNINENINIDDLYENELLWQSSYFKFNGDHIDYLYLDYYLQEQLDKDISPIFNSTYEESLFMHTLAHFTIKYVEMVNENFGKQTMPIVYARGGYTTSKEIEKIKKFSLLEQINKMIEIVNKDEDTSKAYEISKEIGINEAIKYLLGADYCNFIHISGSIKSKYFYLRLYQPLNKNENITVPEDFKVNENALEEWKPKDFIFSSSKNNEKIDDLTEYQIKIESIQSVILHSNMVKKFAVLDINERYEMMYENINSGEYDKALQEAQFVYSTIKSQSEYNNIAFIQMMLFDFDSAEENLYKSLKERKKDPTTLFNLAYIHYTKNELLKAEQLFKEVGKLMKKIPIKERQLHCLKIPLLPIEYLNQYPTNIDFCLKPDLYVASQCSLCILSSIQKNLPSASAYLKNAEHEKLNGFFTRRVSSWVEFYKSNINLSISINQSILKEFDAQLTDLQLKQLNSDYIMFTK